MKINIPYSHEFFFFSCQLIIMDEAKFSQNDISKILSGIINSGGLGKRAEARINKLNDKLGKHLVSVPIIMSFLPEQKKKQISDIKKPKNAWQIYLGESVSKASIKWKSMKEIEKKPYTDKAKKLYDEYLKEMALDEEKKQNLTDDDDIIVASPIKKTKKIKKTIKTKKYLSSDSDDSDDTDSDDSKDIIKPAIKKKNQKKR